MGKKLRVGVVFGGRSGEHEISLRSAESIINAIDKKKYEVVPIGISKEGRWLQSANATALLPEAVMSGDDHRQVAIIGDPTRGGLTRLGGQDGQLSSEPLDVIFPVLHGTYGEDGTIQGLLEMAGVPYVGWSAGSNVACPTIRTTNDMPVVEPPSFDALSLVPFQINPHYTSETLPGHHGETRDERLMEFVHANPGVRVVGLREGTILKLEGPRVSLLGGKPARIFLKGEEPGDVEPEQTFDFLLR